MKALFGRKVADLKELKELTEAALKDGLKGADYYITKEVELEDEAFKKFSDNFFKNQSWITKEDGGTNKNGQIKCIRVRNKATNEIVLVNNEGYSYARYTALEFE